jgi:NADPH:quinone reductase-like Zn-dependent oxidoreductase
MKVYVFAEPGKLDQAWQLVEREAPAVSPGQVLVGVRAVSLNHREILQARGVFGAPPRGRVPGSDAAGEVLEVGAGVTELKPGDRVMTAFYQGWLSGPGERRLLRTSDLGGALDGVLAETLVLPAAGLVKIPDYLSFEEASTLPCAALTAWHALMESGIAHRPGDTVLTLGSGGVSLFALQLAKIAGLRVIAISGNEGKLERLRALGAEARINYNTTPDWSEAVKQQSGGDGVDHVIEVGGGTLLRSVRSVKPDGRVSVVGAVAGRGEAVDTLALVLSRARLQTITVGSVEMFRRLTAALSLHQLRPIIDAVYPFEAAPEALTKLATGTHFGKIVIRVS